MPKGENPKSRRNLVAGKNKKPNSKKTPMQLSEKARELAAITGDGNMTEGVEQWAKLYQDLTQDKLFVQSPVFIRVKYLIEAIAHSKSEFSEQAEALIYELEDLLIEEAAIEPNDSVYIA